MSFAHDGLHDGTRRQEVHVQSFDCRDGLTARLLRILVFLFFSPELARQRAIVGIGHPEMSNRGRS
jgi:hypothetical protein